MFNYEEMKNEIILADCMDIMKDIPDKWFELAIVDPPYGIGISNKTKLSGASNKDYKIKDWDNASPTIEYFEELRRVSKEQIIWGIVTGKQIGRASCRERV